MLTVELDIFSGRPNPLWTLTDKQEEEMLERLSAHRELIHPAHDAVPRLGYRGYKQLPENLSRKGFVPIRGSAHL